MVMSYILYLYVFIQHFGCAQKFVHCTTTKMSETSESTTCLYRIQDSNEKEENKNYDNKLHCLFILFHST